MSDRSAVAPTQRETSMASQNVSKEEVLESTSSQIFSPY